MALRVCDRCGYKIAPGTPRKRVGDQMLGACCTTKEAVMTTAMRKQAHDSGDGETIYHCPFCGSGQVIARSDRTIECQFCHVCFTVQVQPQYPAFPQTINGMPVEVPGMPGQVDPGPGAMGAPMPGGPMEDGMQPDMEDPNAPVDPDAVDEDGEVPEDDEEDGGNPFAKKSYRTADEAALTEEAYIRHLAIRHSVDPLATATLLKGRR